ncbi:MAG: phosphoribosyl-AMP cyclohydrolase [Actinobacteria bacterium]|nr:phosphoribosyl-AMP cyclohydrolase [Actinomycetota bacterium]
MGLTEAQFAELKFDDQGLIPAVVQHHRTGEILMVAYMNAESLGRTLDVGETVFWSRSRQELWHKGATSGNTQPVTRILYDCDGDCLVVQVDVPDDNVACHTGERTCFFRDLGEVAG